MIMDKMKYVAVKMCSCVYLCRHLVGVTGYKEDGKTAQLSRDGNRHRHEGVKGHRLLQQKITDL